jgi:hypothetical protein
MQRKSGIVMPIGTIKRMGNWMMVHREELRNSSICMSSSIKWRKVRWVARVALVRRKENSVKVQFVESGEKMQRGRNRRRYYNNIKRNNWDKNVHLMAVDQEESSQVTFWTEVLSSAQCREIVDQLKACYLAKKDAALRIPFYSLCDFYCYNVCFTLVSLLRTHTNIYAGLWARTSSINTYRIYNTYYRYVII